MPPSALLALFPSLLCALGWAMSSTPSAFTPLPPHASDMSHWDNASSHPPPSAYAWPPPPWLTTGTLLPGQEAIYAGCQPLLEANGCPFPSHSYPPPPPPHLRPAATALPSRSQPKMCPIFGHASASDNENSLPAPTLASILVETKPGAMAASEAVSGK